MGNLTSIGDQKTPGRPTEITFAADTGLPSANQEVLLIGKRVHASSGTVATHSISTINNSGDAAAAKTEAEGKFGVGSELAKMVVAAVKANEGKSTRPVLKCCVLAADATAIGEDAAEAIKRVKAEFVVSPFAGNDETTRNELKSICQTMSEAQRVENNQFGTVGVVFERAEDDIDSLDAFDTQYIMGCYLPDSGSPTYSIGEAAAACAARAAGNVSPFNPLDDDTIANLAAPADSSEHLTVGAGLESEAVLAKGWTPLRVKPNGEVAFVRTVTGRLSADGTGTPVVTSYYDLQDFQVLYFWRKTVYTRLAQPDLKKAKASEDVAKLIKSELIRLANLFQDQNMFQAVDKLAKQFQVVRSSSDRHRFDIKTPVNVIPGLHVLATNIEATTQYDTISV